jgi:hypothetical protein
VGLKDPGWQMKIPPMTEAPRFRFWVRRSPGEDPTFSVRFEVRKGKGLLRVARPGVLVDPPARQSGYEERLSAAQVRASRFLHVWDAGRKRQGYVLSRLSDDLLLGLPQERWVELSIESDGGFCWLIPRGEGESEAAVEFDDEPTRAIGQELDALSEVEVEFEDVDDPISNLDATMPLQTMDPSITPFGKATTLVRHMRREQVRDAETIRLLEARVSDLEHKLEAARKREIQLRTRVARYQRRLKARESVSQK